VVKSSGETTPWIAIAGPASSEPADTRAASILRDITVGGLAALVAGVLVGGLGGRVVMRLTTLLVPTRSGR
jgi:hypothetical protein